MENSLALFPTTFLWFLHCIFLGKLDRRGCRVFSSFLGYLTLGDGLRSRASPAHHLLLSRKRLENTGRLLQRRFHHSESLGDHPKLPIARSWCDSCATAAPSTISPLSWGSCRPSHRHTQEHNCCKCFRSPTAPGHTASLKKSACKITPEVSTAQQLSSSAFSTQE